MKLLPNTWGKVTEKATHINTENELLHIHT